MARRATTLRKPARKRPRRRKARAGNPPPWIPERTNLTPAEVRLLSDPTRLTEDDADMIATIRSEMSGEPEIPIDDFLRKHGLDD